MKQFIYTLFLAVFLFSCGEKPLDPDKPVYVKISTSMGDVTVRLYDDTPLHRDNFIRLCRANTYDGLLFHRVIQEFVVQGGDPTSKEREPGKLYGHHSGGYTVPAEILPHYFNKRGALIDAKKGDDVNPERASAGTQFCFVQGKVLTDEEMDEIEKRINTIRRNWFYYTFTDRLKKEQPELADESAAYELDLLASIMVSDTLDVLGPAVIPPEHREVYKTIGGVPHLDGSVSIWGEVVEGFDIVEKISLVETDQNDRPLKDVIIQSTKVFQKDVCR
ncbi:MAG: peptidylprolyl isomerase [Tannerellaceae bacterium]|nr:peptidylprolyl isomerase [Tannerellaceae bacterium]